MLGSELSFALGYDGAFVMPANGAAWPPVQQAAIDRLLEQFREQPNWRLLIAALAFPAQDFEDNAITPMPSINVIDESEGVQLDVIGKRIGELRQGFADDIYQLHLKARCALNRCSGNPEQIMSMFRTLVAAGVVLQFEQQPPAGFTMRLLGAQTDDAIAPYLVKFLRAATDVGVNGQLEWLEASPANSFILDGTTAQGLDSGVLSSAQ